MTMLRLIILLALAFLLALTLFLVFTAPPGERAPVLSLPIDCVPGQTCFLQQYVDRDPGPDVVDYRCGHQTYNGHKGTDFRLPDTRGVATGVAVYAAAPGRVKGVRDGEPDIFSNERPQSDIDGRECGNGVVIDHGQGWETQYCHMKEGSVRVRPGDIVTSGDTLGLVGYSGRAEFPHLHLSVRYEGQVVDPFAVEAGLGTCGEDTVSMWSDKATAALRYEDALIRTLGFASGAVDNRQVEGGVGDGFTLNDETPALVVFARMINAKEGDRLALRIEGPQGFEVSSLADPAPNHQAQRMGFAGRKRPAGGWPKGEYRATVSLLREGAVIERRDISLTME